MKTKQTTKRRRPSHRTTSVRLPSAVLAEVDRLAAETRRSRSAMIGVLLERIVMDQRESVR